MGDWISVFLCFKIQFNAVQSNLNLRLQMSLFLYLLEKVVLLFVPFKSKQRKIKQLTLQHCGVDSRKVNCICNGLCKKILFFVGRMWKTSWSFCTNLNLKTGAFKKSSVAFTGLTKTILKEKTSHGPVSYWWKSVFIKKSETNSCRNRILYKFQVHRKAKYSSSKKTLKFL